MPLPSSAPAPAPQAPSAAALAHQGRRLTASSQTPWLHEEVARRMADKLEAIRLAPQDWVHWSAFLGGGAEPVGARHPQARRWVVEPTPGLAERSAEQLARQRPRTWRDWWVRELPAQWTAWHDAQLKAEPGPADVRQPPWLRGGAQMLWANMTLHASADLPALMARWHRLLATDGFLMCSGLGPDTARELRELYAALGWPRPTIEFIDMHDLGDELVKAGFAEPVMDMERITLTWADAPSLLAELRTWGGNVAVGRHPGLRTPRWRERLLQALQEGLRGPDGRLRLTVEVVYGHALKPLPRARVQAETRVALDDMRRMVRKQGQP